MAARVPGGDFISLPSDPNGRQLRFYAVTEERAWLPAGEHRLHVRESGFAVIVAAHGPAEWGGERLQYTLAASDDSCFAISYPDQAPVGRATVQRTSGLPPL